MHYRKTKRVSKAQHCATIEALLRDAGVLTEIQNEISACEERKQKLRSELNQLRRFTRQ